MADISKRARLAPMSRSGSERNLTELDKMGHQSIKANENDQMPIRRPPVKSSCLALLHKCAGQHSQSQANSSRQGDHFAIWPIKRYANQPWEADVAGSAGSRIEVMGVFACYSTNSAH